MQTLRTFLNKLLTVFKTNPITITATGIAVPSFGVVSLGLIALFNHFGVQLPDWAIYTISGVVSAIMLCLTEWGIIAKGWETCDEKCARLEAIAKAKEEALQAKAKAEEEARILAEAQAKLEEEQAKAQSILDEAKAKLEEEKALAAKRAHDLLVAQKLAELKAQAK